jgi:hypothetical protein
VKSVLLDKASCKKLANDPAFANRYPELQGRVMPFEEYKKQHVRTGCSECTWGTAMAMVIQNETINNQGFRNRLMKDLLVTNLRIMKDGRILSFDL